MSDKSPNPASENPKSSITNVFYYCLVLFNIVFLAYVLTIGYHNRLTLDDYSFLGTMRDHGFFSPFTFWYSQYQGRFAPQFFINTALVIYKVLGNMFFYTALISTLFIGAIYQILRFYLPLSRGLLFNYSIFLFSALVLTTFELTTFYWLNVSAMYFGGVLFALLGTVFILKDNKPIYGYIIVAFCFLYVGSSSEHAGIIGCSILGLSLLYTFYKSGYNFKKFFAQTQNRKLLVASVFCFVAFVVMVVAPGNKIRMSSFQQVTDPQELIRISYKSSIEILYHIFYRLPYILALVAPIALLGTLGKDKIQIGRFNLIFIAVLCTVGLCLLIFLSNIPAAYAMGTAGPLRSFVFINFFLVVSLFVIFFYAGYRYLSDSRIIGSISILSVILLGSFVFYSFKSELPLVKKYYKTDKARVALLKSYQKQQRTEKAYVQPLFRGRYITITDMFRIFTHTMDIPSPTTDMPLFIGDMMEEEGWQNNHIRNGLGLNFEVALDVDEELTKFEMDSIKSRAEKAFETGPFKFYILDSNIYYQVHVPSFPKLPAYIYCRIQPVDSAVVEGLKEPVLFYDFLIAAEQVKYKGDVPGYEYSVFVKKEITKFPIKRIETGFYDVSNGAVEFSNGIALQFTPTEP